MKPQLLVIDVFFVKNCCIFLILNNVSIDL